MPTAFAVAVFGGEPDQVRVIIFALFERRQRGAVDLDQQAAKRFGGAAVIDALEPRDRGLAAVADAARRRLSAPPTIQFLVARQAFDAVAEQLEPDLALDAMRAGDGSERDSAPAVVTRSRP